MADTKVKEEAESSNPVGLECCLGSGPPRDNGRQMISDGRVKMSHAPRRITGPRTAEGLERSRRARWKHGQSSAAALAEQKRVRVLLAQSRELLKQMQAV